MNLPQLWLSAGCWAGSRLCQCLIIPALGSPSSESPMEHRDLNAYIFLQPLLFFPHTPPPSVTLSSKDLLSRDLN